jgi:hypothetical protein
MGTTWRSTGLGDQGSAPHGGALGCTVVTTRTTTRRPSCAPGEPPVPLGARRRLTEGVSSTGTTRGHRPGSGAAVGVPLSPAGFTVAFPAATSGGKGPQDALGPRRAPSRVRPEVACVTCHAVHGDERTACAALAVDPVRDLADELCELPPRPAGGGTSEPRRAGDVRRRTYHPATMTSPAAGRLPMTVPGDWPLGGAPRRLLCAACQAHGAVAGTALVRPCSGGGLCEVSTGSRSTPPPDGGDSGPAPSALPPPARRPRLRQLPPGALRPRQPERGAVPILRERPRRRSLLHLPGGRPTCGGDDHRSSSGDRAP